MTSVSSEHVMVEAPAKLTMSLRIVGVRGDGLHLIDAEMVSLDLVDQLRIGPGVDVTITGPAAGRLAGPAGPDDLVRRALELVDRDVAVTVTKHIPAGAGLGGGSSDAAAVLRWAGFDDVLAASRLGADVSFCLVGGRARVSGIGEQVEPLGFQERTFTLLTPPVHCSTPVVYRAWDELGGPSDPRDRGNDLTDAALHAYPELAPWRDRLGDASGQEPRLAGSGSTWFVDGSHPMPGARVVWTIPAR